MKTWVITGCSSGLGRSLAKEALRQGLNVVVTARNIHKIKDLVKDHPHALALKLDVTSQEDINEVIKETINKFGNIDVLVNNAGYGYRSAIEEGDSKDVNKLFNTNVWGPINLIKAILPYMRQQNSGTIINVSSIAAIEAAMGSGYYAASKSALESLSESLKKEVGPLGINVMIVEPGAFRTDFAGRSLTQSQKVIHDYASTAGKRRIENDHVHGSQPGDPDKAAKIIIRVVESKNIPSRLLLGSDAINYAYNILNKRLMEYEKWESLSIKTDYKETK